MRILFVTPFYFPELKFGGPPKKIHALARGLSVNSCRVKVVTFDHADPSSMALSKVDGVSVQYLPWAGRGLRQLPKRRALLADAIAEADIVHCYGLYTALIPIAARLARRAGKPVVQEPLGMYPPRARNQLLKRLYNVLLTRRMLNDAAAIIAASEAEVADLKRFVPDANIVHRRNGIDLEAFASLPSSDGLRKTWEIRPDEQVVLFVGRLSPIKNLEQLIAAFAALKVESEKAKVESGNANRGLRSAKLVFVGPGEPAYEARLRELVRHERLGDSVVFAGALYGDDQKAALALADLFVLPSINESFGNAAGEAVAADVPVLLTDTCGIAPMIHRRAGLAVPLGVDSLAEGLRMMLNSEVSGQMTARREEVKRELSWEGPIKQTIALYERIMAEIRNSKLGSRK